MVVEEPSKENKKHIKWQIFIWNQVNPNKREIKSKWKIFMNVLVTNYRRSLNIFNL